MERKIGEIFEYNGEWYQCVNTGFSCADCDIKGDCSSTYIGACSSRLRKDGKQVRFKKLEKVGEPYVKRVSDGTFSTFQRYKVYNSVILPKEPYIYCNFIDGTIEIEIKQTKEDMVNKKTNFVEEIDALCKRYNMAEGVRADFMAEVKEIIKDENRECKLKPFDLEAAKAGKPVCTRDGRKARIICFDRDWDMHIVALVADPTGESVHYYLSNGKVDFDRQLDDDLMMLPEKKSGWVNICYEHDAPSHREASWVYDKEEEAIKVGKEHGSCYIATVRIEWEE